MEKMERATEKRMFTTYNIYEKIVHNIKNLPGIEWQVQQYNYLYVVHKIISHLNLHKDDYNLGCKINEEYLAKLFGKSNSATADIYRNLIKWNIIYQSVPAGEGNSARYLLHPDHNDDRIFMLSVPTNAVSFIDKIIRFKENELKEDKFILKSYNLIKSHLSVNSLGINYLNNKYHLFNSPDSVLLLDGYEKLKGGFLITETELFDLKNKEKLTGGYGIERRDIPLYLILIGHIICKRPPDKNDKPSRVYNNLTNLPRDHRQYLNFCGKSLLMTDISNSQILLTVPIVEKHYKIYSGKGSVGMPDDIIKFKEWAESGEFYENFSKLIYHNNPMTVGQRKELKIMIFRVLWFGRNTRFKNQNRVKSLFIKHFPNVYKIMSALKKVDYKQFSIELQRFEASIIIDKVARKMLNKHPVLTLHDAIVCTSEEALLDAETRIAKALAKHNITPKFKREDESKYSNPVLPNNDADTITPARIRTTPRDMSKFKPLQKEIYPVDEDYLAKSREYFSSRTPGQIIADYERHSGKKYPKKYLKWLYNRS